MGNRAIIRQAGQRTGVYLHWNGGRDSVEAFLEYCKMKGYHGFETDYGLARFCQVVGNWFGGAHSIGIVTNVYDKDADDLDNGIYDVRGWNIVRRISDLRREQAQYDLQEMLLSIDSAQPEKEQLGEKFLSAPFVPTIEIKIGDKVFVPNSIDGTVKEYEVVGIGEDKWVNGHKALGVPFVNRYLNDGDYSSNVNNYLFESEYRVSSSRED